MSGATVGLMASLIELREHAGKSRALVAAELDISERHLYRLETGNSPIRRVLALAFANYYGVPVEQIDGQEDAS
jgi:transcriptional regulator with XRE-family HTH domain